MLIFSRACPDSRVVKSIATVIAHNLIESQAFEKVTVSLGLGGGPLFELSTVNHCPAELLDVTYLANSIVFRTQEQNR